MWSPHNRSTTIATASNSDFTVTRADRPTVPERRQLVRLAAQMRGGFYPAHERAVALAATLLRAPAGQPFAILDPCAGQGAAIRQLAEQLGCPPEMAFAI